MNVTAAQPKGGSVDLVHLSSNLQLYTGWDQARWHAFMDLAKLDKQATFEEAQTCLALCLQLDLNPARNEIYFIRRKGKLTPQTSIVGFHKVAHSTGMFEGFTHPEWCGEDEVWRQVWNKEKHGTPIAARIGVYHKHYREPSYHVSHWSDYCPEESKDRFMWDKMSAHMILKCAKANALRNEFPVLSGVYTDDEMAQAGPGDTVRVSQSETEPAPERPVTIIQDADFTPVSDTDKEAREEKNAVTRRLMAIAKEKWPNITKEQRSDVLRKFCAKRDLLSADADGLASIRASSTDQIRAAADALQAWTPEAPSAAAAESQTQSADPDPSPDVHEAEIVDDAPATQEGFTPEEQRQHEDGVDF